MTGTPAAPGERLAELESRLAWQEDTLEQLNAVISRQWDTLDQLLRRMEALEDRLAELAARPKAAPRRSAPKQPAGKHAAKKAAEEVDQGSLVQIGMILAPMLAMLLLLLLLLSLGAPTRPGATMRLGLPTGSNGIAQLQREIDDSADLSLQTLMGAAEVKPVG